MKHEFFKMQTPNYENISVSRQTFDEVNELVKYVRKTPPNKIFKGGRLSSEKKKENGFNDFDSFPDAVRALEYGTDMYFEKFKDKTKKVEDFISKREKNKISNYKNDITGFVPIVPNAIIGNPINMINTNIKPKPFPTARIILEKANSAGINSDDICSFYSIVFVLIQLLEKKGIRCEIWLIDDFYEHSGRQSGSCYV